MGDYIGDMKGDTRSLDYSSYEGLGFRDSGWGCGKADQDCCCCLFDLCLFVFQSASMSNFRVRV